MTRRRRIALWTGAGCLVVGFALLGYVGWHLIGTNILSERRQEALVEQLQERWRADSLEPSSADATRDSDAVLSGATALVRIPAFGDDYVMPVLEGVNDNNLASGLAHFTDSAGPGQRGNYALAGHRITHGEPLRDLPELQPGDEVVVETRDAVYTYMIDTHPDDLVVGFDDVWVVDPDPVNPDPGGVEPVDHPRLLTLTTCAELFHTDDRMIAFGHLDSVRRR